ncbi:MAG: hypothetical protein U0V74_07075 [Chitinophagales bacterium]
MHFLSHYYTEMPANNPLFVAALGIPDLTSGFSKIYNSLVKNSIEPVDANLGWVRKGVLAHYEGDKKFHNSPLFMQQQQAFTQSFTEAGLDRTRLRLSVLAHIAVELMLDRQILLYDQNICHQFYDLVDKADEQVLQNYFDSLSLEGQKQEYLKRFHFFKQRRFLVLFDDLESIVFGLNRVYGMVTKTEFSVKEKRQFLTALHNMDLVLRYSWQQILKG